MTTTLSARINVTLAVLAEWHRGGCTWADVGRRADLSRQQLRRIGARISSYTGSADEARVVAEELAKPTYDE